MFEVQRAAVHRRKFCSYRCARVHASDARWEALVERTATCWNWMGTIQPNGYGKFGRRWMRRDSIAHRIAYEKWVGPIPANLTIDHLCFNRRCVNPAHLEVVTRGENARRATANKKRLSITEIRVRRSA